MALRKEPNAEPIPGYRLIELLGRGGCGEVWKCEAPGGLFKAIKFVYGNLHGLDNDRAAAEEELRAIEHIKDIRHPFLLSLDRVEIVQGELIIVTELADRSLHHLLEEYQSQGREGLPREQLLNFLREAAEVLDMLHFQYGLQHLDIKPRNLFVVHNHIKVADFGLVSSLAAAGGAPLQVGAITPLYAAPEIFHGQISSYADQYSLAVTYQELLTGTLPFEGGNSRQLLMQHTSAEPDLHRLPAEDQIILARALAKTPAERFPSCTALVDELAAVNGNKRFPIVGQTFLSAGEAGRQEFPPHNGGAIVSSQAAPLQPRPQADTDPIVKGLTERSQPARHPMGSRPAKETLPGGYSLVKCLDNTPLMERWQVNAPDGRKRLMRILYGSPALGTDGFQESLSRLRSLEHPGLTQLEVLSSTPGRIMLVSDLVEQSLRDYLHRCQSRKLRGIPRADLLSFLLTAAETLDYMFRQHSIQHLSLSPRNLLLDHGRLLIDDFGLGQLIWLPGGQLPAQPNRRYAAPELGRGQVGTSCDQYSLALIYVELLTGQLLRGGQSGHDGLPLDQLSPEDAEIIVRATDPDPARRWPSCLDFIRALENGKFAPGLSEQAAFDEFTALVQSGTPVRAKKRSKSVESAKARSSSAAALEQLIGNLIRSTGGEVNLDTQEQPPMRSADGLSLHHKFSVGVPLGDARLKLDSVREQLYGQPTLDDGQNFGFHLDMPSDFWGKWIGRQSGLDVQVTLARQHALAPTPIDVTVQIRAFRCSQKRGQELLKEMGLPLLEQLRAALLVSSSKRLQERLLWPHPVQVWPILADGTRGDTVTCRGKDISLSGVGFYLPHQLETSEVMISLAATAQSEALLIPATLVRANPCADGWYEVGALFRLTTFRSSHAEMQMKAGVSR